MSSEGKPPRRPRLEGKVAIVTGGGRGIGFHVARAFAREGARVAIADLGSALDGSGQDASVAEAAAAQIRAEGGECLGIAIDVCDPEQARALVAETVAELGRVDALVNAAGIIRPGSVIDLDLGDWDATLRAHLTGTLSTTRAAFGHWTSIAGTGRRLVNISSDAGLFGDETYLAYGVAKAGVVALTLGCVEPLRELGGTANVFIPQAATRMTASIPLDELPDRERWQTGEFDPAHVPPALVYLASNEADWVSGEIIGGWGFEVHRYAKPRRARSMFSAGPWDLDELFARFRDTFEPGLDAS
jgi:NAD(P)-dependent dehydrogenase (short-subunit alcohol dehydrogenase family)